MKYFINIIIVVFILTSSIFANISRNIFLDHGSNNISVKIVNKSELDYKNIQISVDDLNLPEGILIKNETRTSIIDSKSNSTCSIDLNINVHENVTNGIYEIPCEIKDNSNNSWKLLLKGILEKSIPENFLLYSNYPNPFNSATKLKYELKKPNNTKLIIFDQKGNLIKSLVNKTQTAGVYTVVWDGKNVQGIDVPSGIYFYRLNSGNFISTKKMLYLK